MKRYRLGIDIGGTFTDLTMIDQTTGQLHVVKTPSTPNEPVQGVVNALEQAINQYGINPADVDIFVHGTTLGVNALIQRNGARTGLLITKGFGDTLVIGRLKLSNPSDFLGDRPEPLVPLERTIEIDERIWSDGSVLQPLNLEEIEAAGAKLIADGVEAVAVCFMHAYRNDQHERQAAAHLRQKYPELFVSASSELWPQQREYERALLTAMNAYLGKMMKDYLDRLQAQTSENGLNTHLFTMKSNGGMMSIRSAWEVPSKTLLSGPAAGVVGAQRVAHQVDNQNVIALDMGGTSADISILRGEIPYSTENQVGDWPVIIPSVEVYSIGAGGGSIAWVAESGVMKVGPQSAGADPGPACYGRGGTQPTVTDAYVMLGILNPERFVGGGMKLNADLAQAAIAKVAQPLGMEVIEAAEGLLDITTAVMYAKLLPMLTRKGVDPRDMALVAYGGAGPTHAFLLAREIGIKCVIVPQYPGALCALGCAISDVKDDYVSTLYANLESLNLQELEHAFKQLEEQALNWIKGEEIHGTEIMLKRSADMRYKGQSFELAVPINGSDSTGGLQALADAFHRTHEQAYQYSNPENPVEVINVRVTVIGQTSPLNTEIGGVQGESGNSNETAKPIDTRTIRLDRKSWEAPVYDRTQLPVATSITGPAIIEQGDTTTFLVPGYRLVVHPSGNLVATIIE